MKHNAWLSPNGTDICHLEAPPLSILVSTMSGIAELRRAEVGAEWRLINQSLKGHHISSIMVEPLSGALFAGTHGSGLHRSLDGGATWTPAMNGISSYHVFSLGLDVRGDRVTLFAGTEPSMLFRSTDLGDHWEELAAMKDVPGYEKWNFPAPPHIAHTKHIVVDPRTPDTLYVSVEQGALLKTVDGGKTFTVLQFEDDACVLNNDAHRIVFNPANADDIVVTGGDGIFRSRDAGSTWQRIATTRDRVAYPDQFYFDTHDPDMLYAVGGGTPPPVWRQTGDAWPAIIKTDDGGAHWTELNHGIPGGLTGNFEAATMMTWPGGYGFLIGTSDGDVFASFDKGENWETIARDLHPVSKCCHFDNIAKGRAVVAAKQIS